MFRAGVGVEDEGSLALRVGLHGRCPFQRASEVLLVRRVKGAIVRFVAFLRFREPLNHASLHPALTSHAKRLGVLVEIHSVARRAAVHLLSRDGILRQSLLHDVAGDELLRLQVRVEFREASQERIVGRIINVYLHLPSAKIVFR